MASILNTTLFLVFGNVVKQSLISQGMNCFLQKLSSFYLIQGSDDAADPTVCSSLRTFQLSVHILAKPSCYSEVLSWAFPGNKPNENVTSLELSTYMYYVSSKSAISPLHEKFPALKKLTLTESIPLLRHLSLRSFPSFQNLEWLEIKHPAFKENGLLFLSERVGKTLRYLRLPGQHRITDVHLRDLAVMFPVLRTLDLSQCTSITDAILVEWYIKHDNSEWPQLRKLVLKGCQGITQEVVDSVRLRTRNRLLIDL